MPNAIFVRHPISFLPHRRPPPALACRRCSTPSSSVAIVVRGSRRKPPQSSSPIRCLRCLSSLSLVPVVSRRRPPSFQFIARCCRHRRRFLSAVDIIAIYCPPSPHLLSPAQLLVSRRASSPPPSPASTLTSGEVGQQLMGGGVRLKARRNRWTAEAVAAMGVGGRRDGDGRRRRRWHDRGGRRWASAGWDGGALTMRGIEIAVDGGGAMGGRTAGRPRQEGDGVSPSYLLDFNERDIPHTTGIHK